MKSVVWYLPSGSGGMAALMKSSYIRDLILTWAKAHNITVVPKEHLTVTSVNGLRYYRLILSDEDAIIFALSWNNVNPKSRYEYIE